MKRTDNPSTANVVVYNTCSIRDHAEQVFLCMCALGGGGERAGGEGRVGYGARMHVCVERGIYVVEQSSIHDHAEQVLVCVCVCVYICESRKGGGG